MLKNNKMLQFLTSICIGFSSICYASPSDEQIDHQKNLIFHNAVDGSLKISTGQSIRLTHDTNHENHNHEYVRIHDGDVGSVQHFTHWIAHHPDQKAQIERYEKFLAYHLGVNQIPPMSQLLTTARSWQECGFEPYEVPPEELWEQMLPTLKLYNELRWRHILPDNTQIRSVYRSPELNRCAGGAGGSKHLTNSAMDIWVPTFDVGGTQLSDLQDQLCWFWLSEGQEYHFGLGIYATGAIHLDTQGHRKWGGQFSHEQSICRYYPPKS